MSCLKIDILLNDKITTIDTDATGVADLCIARHVIALPDRVYRVSVTSELIIILAESGAFRNGFTPTADPREYPNTINAYNHDGELVWNIADLVGDTASPMVGGFLCTRDICEEWNTPVTPPGHDLYACFDWTGHRYLIDLCDGCVVQKIVTK